MKSNIRSIPVPSSSIVYRYLPAAYFADCYELKSTPSDSSALEFYLRNVAQTPRWVNALMLIRNRIVGLFGLKNLGTLGAVDANKTAADYQVGERVGIFSIYYLSHNEVILTDADKHLTAKVSFYKNNDTVAASTVVHTHNWAGRIYLFFVVPVHRIIVPRMLKKSRSI